MLNKFCITLIVSLIFLIIINAVNLNNLNQATAKIIHRNFCTNYGEWYYPKYYPNGTYHFVHTSFRDCYSYDEDDYRTLVPGSFTYKELFCQRIAEEGKVSTYKCLTLRQISLPAGAPLEELLPGSGTVPPSVEPGDSGPELPPSIEPGDSGTENNTSQNIRKVPKTGILDEPGALSDDESAENDDDTEVRNDLGGPNNDNGPTINPEEE